MGCYYIFFQFHGTLTHSHTPILLHTHILLYTSAQIYIYTPTYQREKTRKENTRHGYAASGLGVYHRHHPLPHPLPPLIIIIIFFSSLTPACSRRAFFHDDALPFFSFLSFFLFLLAILSSSSASSSHHAGLGYAHGGSACGSLKSH